MVENYFKRIKMKTKKVVINRCYGGFGLSNEAFEKYLDIKGIKYTSKPGIIGNYYADEDDNVLSYYDIPRDDPDLVKIVEEFGDKASGTFSELKIVEIPDDIEWEIEEYDGMEWVAEKHRTWR
jgi:hypothetical protein